MQKSLRVVGVALVAGLCVAGAACAPYTKVSQSTSGGPTNGASYLGWPTSRSISSGGRYVAFYSDADNLVPGDNDKVADVFVRDTQTGATTRISEGAAGGDPHSGLFYDPSSANPSISGDGRYVAFDSYAADLIAGPLDRLWNDIFVRDRSTGTTQRVSVDTTGGFANQNSAVPAISTDGRHVAFQSDATDLVAETLSGASAIYVRNLTTAVTTLASPGVAGAAPNGMSLCPSISADGRYVLFMSYASNLVAGDTNNTTDVFVRDLVAGTTTRVSTAAGGVQGNGASDCGTISDDGQWIGFHSIASNLVPGDTNGDSGAQDAFVRHWQDGSAPIRVSVTSSGAQTHGNNGSPAFDATGRFVTWASAASDLVPGDHNGTGDVFLRDMATGSIRRISTNMTRGDANGASDGPMIDATGKWIVFSSDATNLVPSDTNGKTDVFKIAVAANAPKPTAAGLVSDAAHGGNR